MAAISGATDIAVEVIVDYGLVDVVAERFDAGVRLGEQVAKDMIAVRISQDIPIAVVGAPEYFKRHSVPTAPSSLSSIAPSICGCQRPAC